MLEDKVVYVVYHDLSTEARSYEMLCALNKVFSNVVCVCRKPPIKQDQCEILYPSKSKNQYLQFYKLARATIKKHNPKILVLHDEFTAPFFSIGRRLNSFIVFDSSELNFKRVLPGIKNKLAKVFYDIERKGLRHADLVFAANIERLNILRDEYKLTCQMEVFDNVHRIDDEYNELDCAQKYGQYFKKFKYPLVYGGGIAHGRFTFDLVNAFAGIEDVCVLIIGSARETCKKEFEALIANKKIKNSFYLGFVPRGDFKYLLENAFASFVLFKADCPNTENCASGKMYESLFLNTPIICSDNPPLKRICDTYGVGESSMDFVSSYKKILANHDVYKKNIEKYIETIDYNHRIDKLGDTIINAYLKHVNMEVGKK